MKLLAKHVPPDIAIVTGFGDKGISELKVELDQKMHPHSNTIIPSAPWHKALDAPETVIARVAKAIDAIPSDHILLIGHSYGALIALLVACRRELQNILKVILIDGPLNPYVDVHPAHSLHNIFFRHYEQREALARECEKTLRSLDASKIMTIGSEHDQLVPAAAKQLPDNGNFQTVILNDAMDVAEIPNRATKGLNVVLPDHYRGHGLHHKIPIISDIIEQSVRWTLKSEKVA